MGGHKPRCWGLDNLAYSRIPQKEIQRALNPDIATFYIGHNDLLSFTRFHTSSYTVHGKEIQTPKARKAISGRLPIVPCSSTYNHIYAPSKRRAAVPIDHAPENLSSFIENLLPSKTTVLLMSEGLSPDPGPLSSYNELMIDFASKNERVYYLDIAETLHTFPSTEIYMDDCHLTKYGHSIVAKEMYNGNS